MASTFLALDRDLTELFTVAQDQVHVLVKGHELAHKHAAVLDGDAHTVVDEREHLPAARDARGMHGHRLRTQANGTASSKVSHCEFAEVSFWRIVRVAAAGARGSSKRLSASAWKAAVTRTAATMARMQHGQRTARRRGLTIVSRRPRRRQTTPALSVAALSGDPEKGCRKYMHMQERC